MTECNSDFLFNYYPKRQLSVDFAGGNLTSDAGLLLVRQADETLSLTKGLASCIADWRNPFFITHTLTDQVRQRVYKSVRVTKMPTIVILSVEIPYSKPYVAACRKKMRI